MTSKSVRPVPDEGAEKILADPATKRACYRDKNKRCRIVAKGAKAQTWAIRDDHPHVPCVTQRSGIFGWFALDYTKWPGMCVGQPRQSHGAGESLAGFVPSASSRSDGA